LSGESLTGTVSDRRRLSAASSGRFPRHGWRLDVYVDFLGLTATAGKLTAEKEERCGHDDHKDYEYRHHCGAAATTLIISHKINPPLCAYDSHLVGDMTVRKMEARRKSRKPEGKSRKDSGKLEVGIERRG
jgi:hypothetical protein